MIKLLEKTLQGLAYWVAYKKEVYKVKLSESVCVNQAHEFLQATLPHGYKICEQYHYSNLGNPSSKELCDLAILDNNGNCLCLIEFKLEGPNNGGWKADVEKMSMYMPYKNNISFFVVVVCQKPCAYNYPKDFVAPNGKTLTKTIHVPLKKSPKQTQAVKVRRVSKAFRSINSKAKKVVCIELV